MNRYLRVSEVMLIILLVSELSMRSIVDKIAVAKNVCSSLPGELRAFLVRVKLVTLVSSLYKAL